MTNFFKSHIVRDLEHKKKSSEVKEGNKQWISYEFAARYPIMTVFISQLLQTKKKTSSFIVLVQASKS